VKKESAEANLYILHYVFYITQFFSKISSESSRKQVFPDSELCHFSNQVHLVLTHLMNSTAHQKAGKEFKIIQTKRDSMRLRAARRVQLSNARTSTYT
jgi:hypothetical protein